MKQLIDQSAHFGVAFVTIGLLLAFPSPATAALVGMTIGLVRELTEEGSKVTWPACKAVLSSPSSMLDIGVWALGGAWAAALCL